MKVHFNLKTGFRLLCISMKIFGIWPVPESPKMYSIFYRSLWWFYVGNHLLLLFPSFHTFLNHDSSSVSLASITWLEMTGMIECLAVLINFKIQEKRLKELLVITKNQINSKEPLVSLENANLYVLAITTIAVLYVIVMYIYMHRLERTTIITTTRYTFSLEPIYVKILIFCNQFIVMSHTAVVMVTDAIFVLFSYTCAVRLKLLERKMKITKNYDELKKYIYEHQNILTLIDKTNDLVGVMVVKSILCFMSYSIGVGLQIIDPNVKNIEAMNNFLTLVLIYLRLFICAESAETMATVTSDIERAMYFTCWYEESKKSVIVKTMIIHRCQRVPRIHVIGFMPELNRHYIGKIFCMSYTYFMAIRTIVSQ